ncbi:unnamed protein product, partial [Ectocarpus fasciculatus]
CRRAPLFHTVPGESNYPHRHCTCKWTPRIREPLVSLH